MIERGIKMKLKDLISLMHRKGPKHMTIRIQLMNPTEEFIYEGVISHLYNEVILKDECNTSYNGKLHKSGVPIGEYSVLEFTRYKPDLDGDNMPVYNWPINITIY